MRFQHVAQRRQSFFGLGRGTFRLAGSFALDDVATALAADVDEVGFLELLDEIGEAAGAVSLFGECRIQLQHGGFQQAELRLDGAAFQNLERAFHQRHGLREIERRGTAAMSALAGRPPPLPPCGCCC